MTEKILLVLTRPPYPAVDGTRERILNEIEDLSKDFDVSLLIIGNEKLSPEQTQKLQNLGAKSIEAIRISKAQSYFQSALAIFTKDPLQTAYFWHKQAYSHLKENCHQFTAISFHTIRFGRYISRLKASGCKSRILLSFNDAISLNYADAAKKAKGMWKYIYMIESGRISEYEAKMLSLADKASIVTERDRQHILASTDKAKDISVIRHGMDDRLFSYAYEPKTNNLAFIGNLLYLPNRQGLEKFCNEILPLVVKESPETKMVIIGRQSKEIFADAPHCLPMGFIEDPYSLLAEQSIFISPADFGAGLPTKSLLAMSIGLPIVSTANNAQGIDGAKDRENMIFMDYAKPEESAQKIVALLKDADMRKKIGSAAKDIAQRLYRRSSNYPLLRSFFQK